MKIKHGMILAAGLGKRMQPITLKTPKPLIKIGNKNLLDRAIELLINHGIEEIEDGVKLIDRVSYKPPFGILGSIANTLFIGKMLKKIFDYRTIAFKELLED